MREAELREALAGWPGLFEDVAALVGDYRDLAAWTQSFQETVRESRTLDTKDFDRVKRATRRLRDTIDGIAPRLMEADRVVHVQTRALVLEPDEPKPGIVGWLEAWGAELRRHEWRLDVYRATHARRQKREGVPPNLARQVLADRIRAAFQAKGAPHSGSAAQNRSGCFQNPFVQTLHAAFEAVHEPVDDLGRVLRPYARRRATRPRGDLRA
jgi:hypothetical protein